MKRLFIALCQSRFEESCAGPAAIGGGLSPWRCRWCRRCPAWWPCPPPGSLPLGAGVLCTVPSSSGLLGLPLICLARDGRQLHRVAVAPVSPLSLAAAKPVSEAVPMSDLPRGKCCLLIPAGKALLELFWAVTGSCAQDPLLRGVCRLASSRVYVKAMSPASWTTFWPAVCYLQK